MNKLHQLIGKLIVKLVGYGILVLASALIVTTYYEVEKEEIFFEALNYFESYNEIARDEMFNQNGLLHQDSIQKNHNEVTNI